MPRGKKKIRKVWAPRGVLGQFLLEERRARGMTLVALGRRTGMSPGHVCDYEIGSYPPRPISMRRLLLSLDLPQEFAPFLVALARAEHRVGIHLEALHGKIRDELVATARSLIRDSVRLRKKDRESQRKDAAA